MARAKALSVLRADVRKFADIGPDTTTGRHTNAEVNAMINNSWQAMREEVSQSGDRLYLKSTTPAAMTQGPIAGMAFGSIALPADCVAVYGFDLTVSSQDIRSLQRTSFSERNEHGDAFGGLTGTPIAFFPYNIGTEAGAAVAAGALGIVPAPDRAYTYVLWYLPAWVDRTQETDLFDGLSGWDEWVVWHCVLKVATADPDMNQTAQLAASMLQMAQDRMLRRASAVQRVGPPRKVDMRARERRGNAMSFWRRP